MEKLKQHLSDVVTVYAYSLMDNHFHLVIKTNNEQLVTQKLSNFFNAYAKAFNKQENRTGSLFEKHFRRIRLEKEDYLKNVILYIHLNPKKHLNIDFTSYKFSSYQTIISQRETKIARDEVINLFETVENFVNSHQTYQDNLIEDFTFE